MVGFTRIWIESPTTQEKEEEEEVVVEKLMHVRLLVVRGSNCAHAH